MPSASFIANVPSWKNVPVAFAAKATLKGVGELNVIGAVTEKVWGAPLGKAALVEEPPTLIPTGETEAPPGIFRIFI